MAGMEPALQIGDRVQVADGWFVVAMRGKVGTIIPAHAGAPDLTHEGVYWVAFDEPVDPRPDGSFTDSAEIDLDCLRRI
jgi:hypothetical protein